MRRDHLDAVLAQLLIEWNAVVGAIADQILRLGLDHVEVEAQLYQPNFVVIGGHSMRSCARTASARRRFWSLVAVQRECRSLRSSTPSAHALNSSRPAGVSCRPRTKTYRQRSPPPSARR